MRRLWPHKRLALLQRMLRLLLIHRRDSLQIRNMRRRVFLLITRNGMRMMMIRMKRKSLIGLQSIRRRLMLPRGRLLKLTVISLSRIL